MLTLLVVLSLGVLALVLGLLSICVGHGYLDLLHLSLIDLLISVLSLARNERIGELEEVSLLFPHLLGIGILKLLHILLRLVHLQVGLHFLPVGGASLIRERVH